MWKPSQDSDPRRNTINLRKRKEDGAAEEVDLKFRRAQTTWKESIIGSTITLDTEKKPEKKQAKK